MLQKLQIDDFVTVKGKRISEISLTYQVFGKPLQTAPVVLVNHALTGNSTVCGENGWWNGLIGEGKPIDTTRYTILSFDIPGNGYDGVEENLIQDYKQYTARDIAAIFSLGLELLAIKDLYAVIGGSVGGGIAWELAILRPTLIKHLIPIATDHKSTDWLKANCLVQEQILLNSENPVHDARLHAMLIYRSPKSFKQKFDRSYNDELSMYNVESWLLHHGKKLDQRFTLSAYKALNHILANIDIVKGRGGFEEVLSPVESTIHIISVDSDLFFTVEENKTTYQQLEVMNKNVTHGIITSDHGHDAFLIEYQQLGELLDGIF